MDTVSVSVCPVHWNYPSPVRYVAERRHQQQRAEVLKIESCSQLTTGLIDSTFIIWAHPQQPQPHTCPIHTSQSDM